jgi:hypothetical protein
LEDEDGFEEEEEAEEKDVEESDESDKGFCASINPGIGINSEFS